MESSTDTSSVTDGEATGGNSTDGTTGTRRKLSDQQEAEVTRLYAETDTPVSEISKRFGIGESSVYRVAQRHGAALRGRTATSGTAKPRAVAPAAAPVAAATSTPGTRGRGRAAGARPAATPSGNGRRTRGARAAGTTRRTTAVVAVAATPAAPRAAASGARREFRVSFVAVRVFSAVDMADAIQQAEAAGATDITGIVRND
jgi:transposase-like protein